MNHNELDNLFELIHRMIKTQTKPTIIGAIAGDIMGSTYEWNNVKSSSIELFPPGATFTDDTVMTIAIADAIVNTKDYTETLRSHGRNYPDIGYGHHFYFWLFAPTPSPYNSFGNGSAMRVSPVGFSSRTLEECLQEAEKTARVSHNHPEGIKGAQAVATAIFLARNRASKDDIMDYMHQQFGYNIDFTLDEIRPAYSFDVSCQGSVPQAIRAFYESSDYESSIRLAISLGGDSDTIACITGGIACAYY